MTTKLHSALLISLLAITALSAAPQSPSNATQNQRPSGAQPAPPPNDSNIPPGLPPAERAARHFEWIRVNGERSNPNMTPTELTEEEINQYFASGRLRMPKGVHQVHFTGDNGNLTADATINFDEIKEGRSSANPLLLMFSGTHDVKVLATAQGAAGRGSVHVQSAQVDGMEVPRVALEFFVQKYVTPKYPNVGLDSAFALPDRIDTAVVGRHVLTLTQK